MDPATASGIRGQVVALLDQALAADDVRRVEVAQEAAILWWRCDDLGWCGAVPPPLWEEALLGLAAWHTGNPMLDRQRATVDEMGALRAALAAEHDRS